MKVLYFKKGDFVRKYNSSRDVIGVLIIKIDNDRLLKRYMDKLKKNDWVVLQ
jgi:hypothetical protein